MTFVIALLTLPELKLVSRQLCVLSSLKSHEPNCSDDVGFFRRFASYSQLFPHACAIIHQGRIGTTAQALRAGCPTLVMPYSLDQPDNAARVQRLGTSRMLTRKQCSASRLTEELKILLEGSCYIEKAAEVGHNMQSENGARVACDAIEKQLEKELVKV
ncbi:MAG: nucleotide disphospho-sugar-binding domain-containing protein [Cyanobacteria bacterium J06634_6]